MKDLKILMCDDSLLVRKKLVNALKEQGFTQLLEAADGEEAIQLCEAHNPDLVLLDIVMPKKDGLEALEEIKRIRPETHVVMVSSVGTQNNLIRAIKLGAENFLQKPITVNDIISVAKKIKPERGAR